jgi:hypothetical protein
VAYVRSSVLAEKRGESLAADTRSLGERAFAALEMDSYVDPSVTPMVLRARSVSTFVMSVMSR